MEIFDAFLKFKNGAQRLYFSTRSPSSFNKNFMILYMYNLKIENNYQTSFRFIMYQRLILPPNYVQWFETFDEDADGYYAASLPRDYDFPLPDIPLTSEDEQYYDTIHSRQCLTDKLLIDEIVHGFNGNVSEYVPDVFLDRALEYANRFESPSEGKKENKLKLVRHAKNDDLGLRRLYAFWKSACRGKFTDDIRCITIMYTIQSMCNMWLIEHNSLAWQDFSYS